MNNIIDSSVEEFVVIDKRIDAAEEQVGVWLSESLRERWEFGKLMLAERKGKQLPKGRLDELAKATGKSRAELGHRMRFAERYSTEDEVARALGTFTSWTQIIQSLPSQSGPQSKPAPKPHYRADEVADLDRQGLTQREIAEETGLGQRSVRHILDREHAVRAAEEKAKADATVIDWSTVTGRAKEREAIMRRQIRKELEGEFEPRVRAEVTVRTEEVFKQARRMEADARRVLDARKGFLTRAQYNLIRSCLHPDSRNSLSDAKLAEAFRIFGEAEMVLLNEADFPTTSRLPSSTAGLTRRSRR